MMSSRQPMAWSTVAVLEVIRSLALPSHTSVPWEKPDRRRSVSNRVGMVSISIPRVKRVLNSGMATAPVGPRILSSS